MPILVHGQGYRRPVRDTRARMRLTARLMDAYTETRCHNGALLWRPWPVRQCRTSKPAS